MKRLQQLLSLSFSLLFPCQMALAHYRPYPHPKPLVQMAILLDTSNSMDGLIEQAKSQLWRIANDLAYASRYGERPTVELALYEYGNNWISPGENYVRQVLPFTSDMDLVSQKLFSLRTNGGNEYCGAAMKDAIDNLRWNTRDDVYKVIFIAGNEPFTQGPVYFREPIAKAQRKGIRVNTIFCGNYSEGVNTQWQEGAMAGMGAYLTIDQNRAVVVDPTPYDDEISRLGNELNQTYVGYGARAQNALSARKRTDQLASSLPATSGAVLERSFAKAAPSAAEADWDIVASISSGKQDVAKLNRAELPAELKSKSKDELGIYFKEQQAHREKIQSRLGELKGQRDQFLAKKQAEKGPNAALSLDQAVIQAVRDQASKLSFEFGTAK